MFDPPSKSVATQPDLLPTPPNSLGFPPTQFGAKTEIVTIPATKTAQSIDVAPGKQQPSVSIEWTGPSEIRIHQPIACQILVRNTSNALVQGVVVRHRLGQGVVCKSSEPKVANEGGELIWNLGTLTPDQSRRIDLVLVSQNRGALTNHATVTFSAIATHSMQVREPQLAVKMRAPDKVIAGETVTFQLSISNPGDGVAEAIKLKAMLPEGLEHARGKVVELDVGKLAPKEVRTMQLVCLAKGDGMQKCVIVASGDGDLSSNDSAQLEILMPKLDVALAGPKMRYLDRHAIYVLKVTNPGSAPANGVEVKEVIPAGFKFHQANNGGQFQEGTRLVTWNLDNLPPGQSKDLAVDLIPIDVGEHRLIAHVKTARGLKSEAELRTVVEGLSSLFMEVSHADDPIEVGAETAYEIRVANTGTKTETNVEVVCTLPAQLEFKGAKCTTTLRYRQEGRELIFEPLPRLAPKADVIYRVQVKGIAPGDIRFRTRFRADGLKEPVLREESTRIYSDDSPVRPASFEAPAPPSSAPALPMQGGSTPAPSALPMPPALPTPIPAPVDAPPPLPLPPSNP